MNLVSGLKTKRNEGKRFVQRQLQVRQNGVADDGVPPLLLVKVDDESAAFQFANITEHRPPMNVALGTNCLDARPARLEESQELQQAKNAIVGHERAKKNRFTQVGSTRFRCYGSPLRAGRSGNS